MRKQNKFYWLFHDTIDGIYNFSEYKEDFETPKGKHLDVIVLSGKDKDGRIGDFLIGTFNISNWNQLIEQIGEDQELWKDKKFNAIADGKKIKLELL